jgi:hypothetical protein
MGSDALAGPDAVAVAVWKGRLVFCLCAEVALCGFMVSLDGS